VEPVDLDGLLAQIADELEPLARGNDVAVQWRAESGPLVEVLTDRTKLKTIVKNLVGNAIKFTPRGRVDVAARVYGETLHVDVRDSGIGIAPDDIAKIFDMFRQLDVGASRGPGGVGLGLHISKRLAERLGGSISVHSEEGVGSTFTLRLPVRFASREMLRLG
jgi:signal transduction histidine kinase